MGGSSKNTAQVCDNDGFDWSDFINDPSAWNLCRVLAYAEGKFVVKRVGYYEILDKAPDEALPYLTEAVIEQYDKIVYHPRKTNPGELNLWRGSLAGPTNDCTTPIEIIEYIRELAITTDNFHQIMTWLQALVLHNATDIPLYVNNCNGFLDFIKNFLLGRHLVNDNYLGRIRGESLVIISGTDVKAIAKTLNEKSDVINFIIYGGDINTLPRAINATGDAFPRFAHHQSVADNFYTYLVKIYQPVALRQSAKSLPSFVIKSIKTYPMISLRSGELLEANRVALREIADSLTDRTTNLFIHNDKIARYVGEISHDMEIMPACYPPRDIKEVKRRINGCIASLPLIGNVVSYVNIKHNAKDILSIMLICDLEEIAIMHYTDCDTYVNVELNLPIGKLPDKEFALVIKSLGDSLRSYKIGYVNDNIPETVLVPLNGC